MLNNCTTYRSARSAGRLAVITGFLAAALVLGPESAQAQYSGHNFRGDFGIMSGSQPDPGLYLSVIYARHGADAPEAAKGGAFSRPLPDGSTTDGDLDLRISFFELWRYYRLGNDDNAFDVFAGIRYTALRNETGGWTSTTRRAIPDGWTSSASTPRCTDW